MLIVNTPADPLNVEYLNGRKYNETHPATSFGMDLRAYYDLDSGELDQYLSQTLTETPSTAGYWWGANTTNNAYHTDQAEYYGARSGTDTDPTSAPIKHRIFKENTDESTSVEYIRSTLDGVTIDFTLEDYLIAYQNSNIKSFAQLNDSANNYEFGFNAILIYYDVFDPSTGNNTATNLYGIYFLNKVEQSGINFQIPLITKEKPNAITKTNGNAFAFKVNLKFDTSIEDVTVERSVNDHTTFGLDLFLDVLTEFRELQTKYNDKITELNNLAIDVDAAKQALVNTSALTQLSTRVSQLEVTVAAATSAFNEANSIMAQIADLNTQIDDLYNNRTSLLLNYNLEAFREGYGISMDKRTPGYLTLSTNSQNYSSTTQVDLSNPAVNVGNTVTLDLGQSGTYVKHQKSSTWTLTSNQQIIIRDRSFKWKKGQTFRLVIDTSVDPDLYNITIKTDYDNSLNGPSQYSKTIAILTGADFPNTNGRTKRPIIEITCTDPVNFTFEVDKILR